MESIRSVLAAVPTYEVTVDLDALRPTVPVGGLTVTLSDPSSGIVFATQSAQLPAVLLSGQTVIRTVQLSIPAGISASDGGSGRVTVMATVLGPGGPNAESVGSADYVVTFLDSPTLEVRPPGTVTFVEGQSQVVGLSIAPETMASSPFTLSASLQTLDPTPTVLATSVVSGSSFVVFAGSLQGTVVLTTPVGSEASSRSPGTQVVFTLTLPSGPVVQSTFFAPALCIDPNANPVNRVQEIVLLGQSAGVDLSSVFQVVNVLIQQGRLHAALAILIQIRGGLVGLTGPQASALRAAVDHLIAWVVNLIQVRAPATVTTSTVTETFNPRHPPRDPPLEPGGAGDCESNPVPTASQVVSTPTTTKTDGVWIAVVKPGSIAFRFDLTNLIRLPTDAGTKLTSHENGHALIANAIVNALAGKIAAEASALFLDGDFVGTGPDEQSAIAAANAQAEAARDAAANHAHNRMLGILAGARRAYDRATWPTLSGDQTAEAQKAANDAIKAEGC